MTRAIHTPEENTMKKYSFSTFFYDLFFFVFAVFYLPALILKGKAHGGFVCRLGKIPKDIQKCLRGKDNIWIHAVSVGEVMVILQLVRELKEHYPDKQIVVTTVTRTGFALAQNRLSGGAVVLYAPLDFSFAVTKYLRSIRPKLYIAAETEIWPNMLTLARRSGVPTVIVNGRISDKAFGRYRRFRFLIGPVVRTLSLACMQSPADAERIKQLGLGEDRIAVTGNMKFDEIFEARNLDKAALHFREKEQVWVAGSTHPGEEEIILNIFKRLKWEFPDLRLILAPRHITRVESLAETVRGAGLDPVLFSKVSESSFLPTAVLVVDTIGDLRSLYQAADVVFIGKSLVGHGGQNLIEPAFFGKPIVFGPHMENFRHISQLFIDAESVIQIREPQDLFAAVHKILKDKAFREDLSRRSLGVIERQRGATIRTLTHLVRRFPSEVAPL